MRRNGDVIMKQHTHVPNLKEHYLKNIVPEMMKRHNYKNINQVPKITKIVLNIGLSDTKENPKGIDVAAAELAAITGQKAKVCRSKKSISNFKLRKGMPIGLKITLRDNRLYEFMERFIAAALPRIRDFSGLNPNGFDKNGNYNVGLQEQYMFPEVEVDKSDKTRGMNITFVTTAKTNDESRDMLALLGLPFKVDRKKEKE